MPALKFDGTINLPTIGSFLTTLITAVVFVMSMKGDLKTHTAQIAQLTQEVGEIRRLHMAMRSSQEKVVADVETNKEQISKNTAVIKKLPSLVSAQVAKEPK